MKLIKAVSSIVIIAAIATSASLFTGCGGVSEAQMEELRGLRSEVSSLEAEAKSLKDERAKLEREIADKNAKLQQCAKNKAETTVNLTKLPK
jgi:septal ring factor EnvC (AmiA/AmiB activator)